MKCAKGHEMKPILCGARPESSEWYCEEVDQKSGERCHQSILMTAMEVRQHSGGQLSHGPKQGE